ncbi:MAG TPA: phosphoenolpyruvate carboxylase, partial [Candidatus Eisenbacteria bacterium]|nr:phosphoenolpyruvate carboxylase [Candidatus Eisenbacteria bacterium]
MEAQTKSPADSSFDALKKDVRFLTTLLGDVIREQEGERLFAKVEQIRAVAKNLRKQPSPALIAEQKRLIGSLGLEDARKVARAFTIYFQVVNIAEETQRVRRLREYEMDPSRLQDMSLRKLFLDLKKDGLSADEVLRFLAGVDIELVLTAHPTEAKRRTVLDHLLRIASQLVQLDRPDLTMVEREKGVERIKETLEILWQTAEIRQRKVEVLDEVDQTLFYFQRTILDLLADMQEKVRREFKRAYGADGSGIRPFVSFGSWVGADRDGNPFVTCPITEKAASMQQRLILQDYLSEARELILKFSQSEGMAPVSKALADSLARDRRLLPDEARELERFETQEVYRKKFSFMHEKLKNTLSKKGAGYRSAEEFLEDLEIVRASLAQNKAPLAARDLERLIDKVRFFGFHLARMDFRDHMKKVHR